MADPDTPIVDDPNFVPGDAPLRITVNKPAPKAENAERVYVREPGSKDLVSSSVPLNKLNGHDGKSVAQLANALVEHLGIQVHEFGNVDGKPFDNIQVLPGETPMQAIERYARMRSIVIGSDANGGLLLIGEHPATTRGHLVEGDNILRANAVVRDDKVYKKIFATGQNKGSDQSNGDPANKQVATRDGTSTRNRVLVVVADVADTQHGIQRRADMEHVFTEGSHIEAHVTVQGWFKDNNRSEDIWRAGEYYTVTSPSLILYDEVLGCAGCVYEQQAGGTTTTMNLVKPIHMNGRLNYRLATIEFRRKQIAEAKAAEEAARVKAGAR
jgi:prophage tail gpP-like protein